MEMQSTKNTKEFILGKLRENLLYLIAGGILIAICIALLLFGKICHPTVVSGSSMYPTFTDGEIVRTEPYEDQQLNTGDVVVAYLGGKMLIKRVVALPGDTVLIREGTLYVNGIAENASFPEIENAGIAEQTVILSNEEYFLLGDNRNDSADSRIYGPAKKNEIRSIVKDKLF